ncbi:hypothetical protein CANCADRAFT_16425, partial [Tortispora caseinolytica NRRL Y-17796]
LTHLAINAPIPSDDDMRKPLIVPIFGEFGNLNRGHDSLYWAECKQNGIYQIWCPMYTMFSRGNIKEKARVLKMEVQDSVVDLYAGIGYFVFSYVKAGAKHVFCWEINPFSIEGLVRGAKRNGFKVRSVKRNESFVFDQNDCIVVFEEDNKYASERLKDLHEYVKISHINLGLLPSSQLSWPVAATIAETIGSDRITIHVHENVADHELTKWPAYVREQFDYLTDKRLEHIASELYKVKTFAPGVYHTVTDL